MNLPPPSQPGRSGYVLFEVVLALTIFATAVLSLAASLNSALETGVSLNHDNAVRSGLRSFIEETRRKEVADMNTEARDEQLNVTFSSTVEDLSLKNKDGDLLNDLYVLHAKATYGDAEAAREETVDLYLYKPKITETADTSATTTDPNATNNNNSNNNNGSGNGGGQNQPSSEGRGSGGGRSGGTNPTPNGGPTGGRAGR